MQDIHSLFFQNVPNKVSNEAIADNTCKMLTNPQNFDIGNWFFIESKQKVTTLVK